MQRQDSEVTIAIQFSGPDAMLYIVVCVPGGRRAFGPAFASRSGANFKMVPKFVVPPEQQVRKKKVASGTAKCPKGRFACYTEF